MIKFACQRIPQLPWSIYKKYKRQCELRQRKKAKKTQKNLYLKRFLPKNYLEKFSCTLPLVLLADIGTFPLPPEKLLPLWREPSIRIEPDVTEIL